MKKIQNFGSTDIPQSYPPDYKLERLMHITTLIVIFSFIIFLLYIILRFVSIECTSQTHRRSMLSEIRNNVIADGRDELVL